jgi:hypothetical protein
MYLTLECISCEQGLVTLACDKFFKYLGVAFTNSETLTRLQHVQLGTGRGCVCVCSSVNMHM